ncbi:ABC transporter substrate-binding protein [Aminirod propionatiphilus]|uniref:ABC transporter substrate-binding protein n=1 Tax=Aminirod propionatiphilus TaxID=3415223 RepID=A0ACD1DWA8_9BACT|nr:ABC transporter substrate-binding protein [Synergistota bacterium]
MLQRGPALALLVGLMGLAVPARAFTTIRLALQWVPQAQFAGYYVAFEKGFYLRRGLDVFIIRGGPNREPVRALLAGEADVGTFFLSAALLYRDRGVPLVHLGQIVGRSHQVLLAWRDRGVDGIDDLNGRKVTLWGDDFRGGYLALFEDGAVTPKLIPQYDSITLFRRGLVDACAAMSYNELHRLLLSGVDAEELTVIDLAEKGYGFPEDGLYALAPFAETHPEACGDFVEATLEGWRYAAENVDEALDIVMAYARRAHVPTNRVHQRWMLERILPSILAEPGVLSREAYERTARTLERVGLIARPLPFSLFRGGERP